MNVDVVETVALLRNFPADKGGLKMKCVGVVHDETDPQLGIDFMDRIILVVPSRTADSSMIWHGSSMTIELAKNPVSNDPEDALIIRCQRPVFDAHFMEMSRIILERLSHSPEADAATLVVSEISKWKSLFASEFPTSLSVPELAGIFAELTVLLRLRQSGAAWGVREWAGPDRRRHDFLLGSDAVEVKATLGSNALAVEIHGIRQLEAPPDGCLFLSVHRLEQSPEGDSVPDLVDRLYPLTADLEILAEKLSRLGLHTIYDTDHRAVRFLELSHHTYWVDGAFPKITPQNLTTNSEALDSVRYTVLLGAVPEAPIDDPAPIVQALRTC